MRIRREQLGLSTKSVAEAIGISEDLYIKYEEGEIEPVGQHLVDINAVLGVVPEFEYAVDRDVIDALERYLADDDFRYVLSQLRRPK